MKQPAPCNPATLPACNPAQPLCTATCPGGHRAEQYAASACDAAGLTAARYGATPSPNPNPNLGLRLRLRLRLVHMHTHTHTHMHTHMSHAHAHAHVQHAHAHVQVGLSLAIPLAMTSDVLRERITHFSPALALGSLAVWSVRAEA